MKRSNILSTLGLSLLLSAAASGCIVRAHGTMDVSGGGTVVYQEPPAPRAEIVTARSGFIFVKGRWNWTGNQWAWLDGHWERERAGSMWEEGRWERRGSSWHWVDGRWGAGGGAVVVVNNGGGAPADTAHSSGGVNVSGGGGGGVIVNNPPPHPDTAHVSGGVVVTGGGGPREAPPAIRVENMGAKAGFIWVGGRWAWNGKWDWTPGHWEREKANMIWVAGRWELQGSAWVWVDGRWDAAPAGPTIRDHRH